MIRNFLDRGTAALLTVLPDRHDVIECISTASQFYILEAIKVVLNKPIDHFHLRLLLTLLPCSYPKSRDAISSKNIYQLAQGNRVRRRRK